jgi:amylosucrase
VEARPLVAHDASFFPIVTAAIEGLVHAGLPHAEGDALLARVERFLPDATEAVQELYGAEHDVAVLVERLLGIVVDAAAARPDELRLLDRRREIAPDWFQSERMVGYVLYVDRFAGTLAGLRERLDYLEELGVTYLHLMPLLRPRPGPNDGGYAVADYREVDPRVGSMAELEALAGDLRRRGISLCVDLVVNHTAPEHEWAQRALAGDERYRAFYRLFPDRTLPDAYERTLREVFPEWAPGNFTWVPELDSWVWTTFREFQWDLDYTNPDVFAAMLETMLFLANRGVEILRLDAVPFLWKALGTDCENQPGAHLLLQAFRALARMAAPATIFKAEAIVPPVELTKYLGAHGDRRRNECQVAYNNQLMVLLWSALAERSTTLTAHALSELEASPSGTAWATYVRGHDDIGWAVSDEDAPAVGLNPYAHRGFLNDFYAGRFPFSFARGVPFQENPATGDARISGTAASLAGVEEALELGDERLLELALRRLLLLYGVVFSYGGIPLVYMGDELALRNDWSFTEDAEKADDNRWLHRPAMDWAAAGRRHDAATVEGRAFAGMRRLVEARRSLPVLHAGAAATPLPTDEPAVLAYARADLSGRRFLGLANFDRVPRSCDARILEAAQIERPRDALATDGAVDIAGGRIHLAPLQLLWLAPA